MIVQGGSRGLSPSKLKPLFYRQSEIVNWQSPSRQTSSIHKAIKVSKLDIYENQKTRLAVLLRLGMAPTNLCFYFVSGQLSSVRRNRASQSIDPPPRSSSSAISAATQLNSSLSNLLQSANTHRQNSTTRRGSGRRESSSTSTSSSVVEGQSSPSSRQNPPNVRRSERRNSSQRESDRERSGSANPVDVDESSQSGTTEASQSAHNRRLAITRRGESSPPNYATISTRVGPGLRAGKSH